MDITKWVSEWVKKVENSIVAAAFIKWHWINEELHIHYCYALLSVRSVSRLTRTRKKTLSERKMKIRRGIQMPFQVQFERCRYAKCTLSTYTHTHSSLSSWMCRLISQTINLIYCPNIKKKQGKKREIALQSFTHFVSLEGLEFTASEAASEVDAIFFNPLMLLLPESWKLIEMDSYERSWVR